MTAESERAWDDHVLHLEEQIDRLRAEVRALTDSRDALLTMVEDCRELVGDYAVPAQRSPVASGLHGELAEIVGWPERAATADPTPQTDTDHG
jgi:hypothetical protein